MTSKDKPIFISDGSATSWRLEMSEIEHIAAQGKQCIVYLKDKGKLNLKHSLAKICEILPEGFLRVGNSDVVNLWHVDSYCGRAITLDNGDVVYSGVAPCYRRVLQDNINILNINNTNTQHYEHSKI